MTIAFFATLLAAACAVAQQDQAIATSPFTKQEAELMSAVWAQIRNAEDYEDIDWQALGLDRAPGNAEARRLMGAHWDQLRQANRFADIDWEASIGYREPPRDLFPWQDRATDSGPFTQREAEQLAAVWPRIRQAANYEDINWQAIGLEFAPGDAEARRLMALHWDELRQVERYSDIDWEAVSGYQVSRRSLAWQERRAEVGPFTRAEAEQLAAVWPRIRAANSFEDIDWRAIGLEVAPGDAEARILMSAHWNELRQAERFSDIDWEATTGYRGR